MQRHVEADGELSALVGRRMAIEHIARLERRSLAARQAPSLLDRLEPHAWIGAGSSKHLGRLAAGGEGATGLAPRARLMRHGARTCRRQGVGEAEARRELVLAERKVLACVCEVVRAEKRLRAGKQGANARTKTLTLPID